MALFTHKKKIKFPQHEINPLEEINTVKRRLGFLIRKEQDIDNKTTKHMEIINNEINVLNQQLGSIRTEIKDIKLNIEKAGTNFENAVKELNVHAKIEDLDKLRRMVKEFDPIEFISYEEFRRIAEEKTNSLKDIEFI